MEMRTIIFNNVFNETSSVLNGTKTQMRCRACCGDNEISFALTKTMDCLPYFTTDLILPKRITK